MEIQFEYKKVPTIKIALIINKNGEPETLWEDNIIFAESDGIEKALNEIYGLSLKDLKLERKDIFNLENNGETIFSKPFYFTELPKVFKEDFLPDTQKIYEIVDAKHDKPYIAIMIYNGTSWLKLPKIEEGIKEYKDV